MRGTIAVLLLGAILQAPHPVKASELSPVNLFDGMGSCLPPEQPFPYKLNKSDPLYDTARNEHQRYLEDMEDYINCLDRERVDALNELTTSFNLFRENFGKDGVFIYGNNKKLGR